MSSGSKSPAPDASTREAKRLRLRELIGLKGVTTQALNGILENCREKGIPEVSAWQIDNFYKKEFAKVKTTLQVPLAGESGEDVFEWQVCRLDCLLQALCDDCPRYRADITRALERSDSGLLDAVLYLDEIVPGNLLKPDNRRKFWAFYIGFMEAGAQRATQEEFWLPLAVLRTSVANTIDGGLSQCVRLLVRSILFEPANLLNAGFALRLERPTLVRVRLGRLIGDESALKAVWQSKGASGTRPCLFCANVVALASDLVGSIPHLVDVSCADPGRFQTLKDKDLWSQFDSLQEAHRTRTKKDFSLLQQAAGLNYHPKSILADLELRPYLPPISITNMDWMHNFLVNGVVSNELHAFLARCKDKLGVRFQELHRFATADWRWPSAQRTHSVLQFLAKGGRLQTRHSPATNSCQRGIVQKGFTEEVL